MESSRLRDLALGYLHFMGRHFEPFLGNGLYQTAVIVVALAACAALIWLHTSTRWPRVLASPSVYCATLLIAEIWARIPWLAAGELNVDESMFLASARKLMFDPVFFRSVDGGTSGPLNYYAVLAPRLLGLPFDYATVHLMNAVCIGGTLVFLYLTARSRLPETYARISVLPTLGMLMGFRHGELLHYSSECLSIVLIAAAAYLLISSLDAADLRPWRFFAIGVIVSALPLAKLQSGPCGLVVGGSALALAVYRFRNGSGKRAAFYLLAGAASLMGGVSALLAAFGQTGEFLESYVEYNIGYANSALIVPWTLRAFVDFTLATLEIATLLKVTIASIVLTGLFQVVRRAWRSNWTADSWSYLFGLCLFAVSIYSVYRPTRPFPHYWLYTVFPAGLVLVFGYKVQLKSGSRTFWPSTGFLLVTLIAPLYWTAGASKDDIQSLAKLPDAIECGICQVVARYAKPGDLISIWGWTPGVYVQTGTVHASRESFTERQVSEYPQRSRFELRYINDLKEHMPVLFVDAVGPGHFAMFSRSQYGHERYPEVNSFIDSRFDFVGDFDGYRLYSRKGGIQ